MNLGVFFFFGWIEGEIIKNGGIARWIMNPLKDIEVKNKIKCLKEKSNAVTVHLLPIK